MSKRPINDLVNCDKAARGVWLVKVPRYLSELWEKNAGSDVGRLVTGLGETGKDVVFKSTTPTSTVPSTSTAATAVSQPLPIVSVFCCSLKFLRMCTRRGHAVCQKFGIFVYDIIF